jgi:putative ABC transport system ATP-binding protein
MTAAVARDAHVALRAVRLCRRYGAGEGLVRAVDEVDLEVMAGQAVAVTGPSGCGKSTLLHLLGDLDRPSSGEVWLGGQRTDWMSERARARLRRDQIGFVFQAFHLMDELSAVENVELPALLADADQPGPGLRQGDPAAASSVLLLPAQFRY